MDQLRVVVEMIFDGGLVAAGDEENLLDAVGDQLLDHVLHDRLARHRQHFLGLRFRCRKKTRSQTRHGDHCALNHLLTIATDTLLYWAKKRRSVEDIQEQLAEIGRARVGKECRSRW